MSQTISMRQLERWVEEKVPMYLVDVRDLESYEKGHLRDAVSVPVEKLEQQMVNFPKDRRIVCYCQRGSASLLACRILEKAGFWTVNVAGGLEAYRGRNFLGFSLTETSRWL